MKQTAGAVGWVDIGRAFTSGLAGASLGGSGLGTSAGLGISNLGVFFLTTSATFSACGTRAMVCEALPGCDRGGGVTPDKGKGSRLIRGGGHA